MDIFAEITGLTYTPFLCKKHNVFNYSEIGRALSSDATFILKIDKDNQMPLSWWVSPKRTRSYPYTRVYDSLGFSGKKLTLIPIFKDEGKDGDRDFLQWDTVSLMSLLGVYVIISYYVNASRSSRYKNKITEQRFDLDHIKGKIQEILSYQSDALHWNLSQIDSVGEIGGKALNAYTDISKELSVEMHSFESAQTRIEQLLEGKAKFISLSRKLAENAQKRESVTDQPKENLNGTKGTITIKNYLGGYYYFTCDEIEIHENDVYIIEGKHTHTDNLPSLNDIKDGLLKMILFTNLENLRIDGVKYNPVPILKLTTGARFSLKSISRSQKDMLIALNNEATTNGFRVIINNGFFV